jgi:hypothetical protein
MAGATKPRRTTRRVVLFMRVPRRVHLDPFSTKKLAVRE